jgi:WD40 repeat protein
VRDSISPRTVLLFEVIEEKNIRKRRTLGGAKFEALDSSHDERIDDRLPHDNEPPMLPTKIRRIAWGFFHSVTENGGLTLPRLLSSAPPSSPRSATPTRKSPRTFIDVRLQMFQYQIITWMDQYQARTQWGWRKNHPTVPPVFLQYQKRSRLSAPTTLYLRLGIARADSTTLSTSEHNQNNAPLVSSTAATGDAASGPVTNDNPNSEVPPTEAPPSPLSPSKDPVKPHEFDWLSKCRRDNLEPCLVPQRVLHSLPSGKQGCSSLAFSPCGQLLAGGVKTGLGEFHLNIYGVNSGTRLCIGRGHQGIIYSIEWSRTLSDGKSTMVIVTASSDGTVRLWQLQLEDSDPDASNAHPRLDCLCEWHHVPSPCYVYCAVFHPLDWNVVVSGGSDGQVRFHTYLPSSTDDESALPGPSAKLQTSSVGVHSVCLDGPSKRLFCGDALGVISVFSCPKAPLDAAGYTRIKSISTGQTSITSMQLHPRKGHLLVHAQPNALLQFELRSYLLLNRNYAGVSCEATLGKSIFSADGKWVVSGSEDGTPRLFASLHGQEVVSGVWGDTFFHGAPVSDVAWSSTAHIVAFSSFGTSDGRLRVLYVSCLTLALCDQAGTAQSSCSARLAMLQTPRVQPWSRGMTAPGRGRPLATTTIRSSEATLVSRPSHPWSFHWTTMRNVFNIFSSDAEGA